MFALFDEDELLIIERKYKATYIITLLQMLDMQCPNRRTKLIPDL